MAHISIVSAAVLVALWLSSSLLTCAAGFAILNYTRISCDNDTTVNTEYSSVDVTALLKELSSMLRSSTDGFANYTHTVEQSKDSPAQAYVDPSGTHVYGLALCRGDVSADDCLDCIDGAVELLGNSSCLQAVIWREWCMMRYSNRSLSHVELTPNMTLFNNVSLDKGHQTGQWLYDLVDRAAGRAAEGDLRFKFATAEEPYSLDGKIEKVYVLAQCTPRLTQGECGDCLTAAKASLEFERNGSMALLPSCSLRFEMYPFFFNTAGAALSQSSPLPAPSSPLEITPFKKKRIIMIPVVAAVLALTLISSIILCVAIRMRQPRKPFAPDAQPYFTAHNHGVISHIRADECRKFEYRTLKSATKCFSEEIGSGGFGTVYKGVLDGEEIAVKRLSSESKVDKGSFMNEVNSLARAQHQNIVKFLGQCTKKDQKLLVYQYVPNGSLDHTLFDAPKVLDWPKRFKIIHGIARGMSYLHHDCWLKIIHRDIKPNNILLDHHMHPKIADFGTARFFQDDTTHTITKAKIGTLCYMAPEYIQKGEYSEKSDVYSFGLIVLEMVTGKKLSEFPVGGRLISYVKENYQSDRPLSIVDARLLEDENALKLLDENEVETCIRIGLSCTETDQHQRPSSSKIVRKLDMIFSNSMKNHIDHQSTK